MAKQSRNQSGVTYLWVLIVVSIIGIGLSGIGDLWAATQRARQQEELFWVAEQFVQAVDSYYEGSPAIVVKSFPRNVQELLEDRRLATIRRHLRSDLPLDHVASRRLELVRDAQGRILGVRVLTLKAHRREVREFRSSYSSGQ